MGAKEREEISRGIAAGDSIRQMARKLDRAASTVSRELKRHGGREAYRASEADSQVWERAGRPKCCRLARHRRLRWRVAQKLALQCSPQSTASSPAEQRPHGFGADPVGFKMSCSNWRVDLS